MSDSKTGDKGWWQTLPGLLTAVAAIITALTGLLVALGGFGIFHRNPASQSQPPTNSSSSLTNSGAERHADGDSSTHNLPLPATTQVRSGSAVYQLLSLQSAPYSPDKISLRFAVRMTNNGSYPSNFWSSSFRLRVNGSLQAPVNLLDELVDSNSSKDGIIEFVIPADTGSVGLQIGDVGVDKPDITIRLSGTASSLSNIPEPLSGKN